MTASVLNRMALTFHHFRGHALRGTGGSELYSFISWVRAAADITGRDLSLDLIDKTSIDSHKLLCCPESPAVDSDERERLHQPFYFLRQPEINDLYSSKA
jgi:hypothetical protein